MVLPIPIFICFQYETRRTGIYAAGCVRQPMNMSEAQLDAAGTAMKAIQCVEHVAKGIAVHPRAWDTTYPDANLLKCTACKRCTEECPFGAIEEDAKESLLTSLTGAGAAAHAWAHVPRGLFPLKTTVLT